MADTINTSLNTNISQVLAVYNGKTGALDADYTYGLDRIAVHDEDTSTGKVQDPLYYLYDGMGRVTELTKPSAQVSDKYRFDAFGVELPGGKMSPNTYKVLNNPIGHNGEQYDPEAGLSYLRNRYYEPETGRFMNRDLLPGYLMDPISMNAYAFVGNNPLQYMEPLGLDKIRRYWIVPEIRQTPLNIPRYPYYDANPVTRCHDTRIPDNIVIKFGGGFALGKGVQANFVFIMDFKHHDSGLFFTGSLVNGWKASGNFNVGNIRNLENLNQYKGPSVGAIIYPMIPAGVLIPLPVNSSVQVSGKNSQNKPIYEVTGGINNPNPFPISNEISYTWRIK